MPRPKATPPKSSATNPPSAGQNIPPELTGLLTGANPADLSQPFGQSVSAVTDPAVASRRRPQRNEVATYRIRIDLDGVEPPIWRELEIHNDLTLDRVHHILQAVMGWTESHLHEFTSGNGPTDPLAEHYLEEQSLDEGLAGTDETEVRLNELLVESGDKLYYAYDFGDNWAHTLHLETVSERKPDAPSAICTAGARACPPEDSGGIWGYQELLNATANPGPDNQELRDWAGPNFDPDRFSIDEVNSALHRTADRHLLQSSLSSLVDPTTPLGDLLSRMSPVPDQVAEAVGAALQSTVEPDPIVKAAMLDTYVRLLDLVGDDGITLTGADYLPPKYVEAVSEIMQVGDFWIGKNNREANTYPVLEFRESARQLGLIRKANHRLSLTKAGSRARTDVGKLWAHLTGALPLGSTTRGTEAAASKDAGILRLIGVAAGLTGPDRQTLILQGMSALGWRTGSSSPLSARTVANLLTFTDAVLEHIYVLPRDHYRGAPKRYVAPAAAASAFGRAAIGG